MAMIATMNILVVMAICFSSTLADQFISNHALYETVKNVTTMTNTTIMPEVVFNFRSRIIGGTPVPNGGQYPSYTFTAGRLLCG